MHQKKLIIIGFKSLRFQPRGIERVIKNQIDALDGYSILLVHYGRPEIYLYNEIECVGIGENLLKLSIIKIFYIYIWKLKNNAIVCSHNAILGFLFLPKLSYVHDLLKNNNNFSLPIFKILKLIEYLTLLLSSKIATVSKCRFNEIIRLPFFNKKKLFLIYNTSNLINQYKKISIRNNNDEIINLLTVRSLERRSNLYWLIDLIKSLNVQASKKYKLNIVGGGADYENLKEYIISKNLDNYVFLLGYIDDQKLINSYENCDAVIIPALFDEGFGLPVIESYSANRPVFVSNVDALPEIVINNQFILSSSIDESTKDLIRFFEEDNIYYDYKKYFNDFYSFEVFKRKTNEFIHN